MAIESSLAQQAGTFAKSLDVRPAPSVEKTDGEAAQEQKIPEQNGDTITISQEARALAAPEKQDQASLAAKEDEQQEDSTIKTLEDRIEKLEQEIKEVQEGDLPEKEKIQKVQAKQVELMELREQLMKAQQEQLEVEGQAVGGGTRANGFGNSVGDF